MKSITISILTIQGISTIEMRINNIYKCVKVNKNESGLPVKGIIKCYLQIQKEKLLIPQALKRLRYCLAGLKTNTEKK